MARDGDDNFLIIFIRKVMSSHSGKKKFTISEIVSYYNIIGLAVGVTVGIAGQQLIASLVNDIIFPLFEKIFRIPDWKGKYHFDVRTFLRQCLSFAIVMGVVIFILYVVIRPIVEQDINNKEPNANVPII